MVLAIVIASCGDNDNSSPNSVNDNSFYSKINGSDYNPEFVNGFITVQGSTISISGSEANGNNVVINFPISANAGDSYTVEGLQLVASYDDSNGDGFISSEGSLTITAHNVEARKVSGTFNFVGEALLAGGTTYTFTEGSFDVTYTSLN